MNLLFATTNSVCSNEVYQLINAFLIPKKKKKKRMKIEIISGLFLDSLHTCN